MSNPLQFRFGQIVKGTSQRWEFTFDGYPSDQWSARFAFGGPEAFSLVAEAVDGGAFALVCEAAATSARRSGVYCVQGFVDRAPDRHLVLTGTLDLLPDVSAPEVSSYHEIVGALDAAIHGRALTPIQAYSLETRSINRESLPALIEARKYYGQLLAQEQRNQAAARGLSPYRTIKAQFGGRG